MYRCFECGWNGEFEAVRIWFDERGEEYWRCPHCGSYEVFETKKEEIL
jgi:DNA-directed RNA polymerase subunit RPC12/RpoP